MMLFFFRYTRSWYFRTTTVRLALLQHNMCTVYTSSCGLRYVRALFRDNSSKIIINRSISTPGPKNRVRGANPAARAAGAVSCTLSVCGRRGGTVSADDDVTWGAWRGARATGNRSLARTDGRPWRVFVFGYFFFSTGTHATTVPDRSEFYVRWLTGRQTERIDTVLVDGTTILETKISAYR